MNRITSVHNDEVKHLVKLQDSKHRKNYNQCVAEGLKTIATLMQGSIKLLKLYATEDQIQDATALAPNDSITIVSQTVMKKISSLKSPGGLVGLFQIPDDQPLTKLSQGLVLAQIHDPGNMGTLIRTAVACGLQSIVCIEGVDPWSPKVIQASAGTLSWPFLFRITWNQLIENKHNLKLCALVVDSTLTPSSIREKNLLLIVGNEGRGIPQEWQQQCDYRLTLPMPGHTESFNAAIAGSIASYWMFVIK